jgi:hypothetical protein
VTAFTDGCPGLRRILADADVTMTPILDWFNIGMRLQCLKQVASGLSCGDTSQLATKGVIVVEVERLQTLERERNLHPLFAFLSRTLLTWSKNTPSLRAALARHPSPVSGSILGVKQNARRHRLQGI